MADNQETFSFPIEILGGPRGERTFEMYRAEIRHRLYERINDSSVKSIIKRSSETFEFNFEMIHMICYLKKRINPLYFDIWPSPLLSAQFWLERLVKSTDEVGTSQNSAQKRRLTTVGTQTEWPDSHVTEASEHRETRKPHRGLPGFNTILQCGATTLADETTLGISMAPLSYNTPTSGRIQRLFGAEDTTCWQGMHSRALLSSQSPLDRSPPDNRVKENLVPMDCTSDAPSGRSAGNPLVELSNMGTAVASTISSNVTSFDSSEKKIPISQPVSTPFEIFHDSCIQHASGTSCLKEVVSTGTAISTSASQPASTPFEIFHDSYIQPTHTKQSGTSVKNSSSKDVLSTGAVISTTTTGTPFEIFHDSCLDTRVTVRTHSINQPSSSRSMDVASVNSKPDFQIFHDSHLQATHLQTQRKPTSQMSSMNPNDESKTSRLSNNIQLIPVVNATTNSAASKQHRNVDPRLVRRASPAKPTLIPPDLDDTAIFDMLEERFVGSKPAESTGNFTEFDSPTRFLQFVNKRANR